MRRDISTYFLFSTFLYGVLILLRFCVPLKAKSATVTWYGSCFHQCYLWTLAREFLSAIGKASKAFSGQVPVTSSSDATKVLIATEMPLSGPLLSSSSAWTFEKPRGFPLPPSPCGAAGCPSLAVGRAVTWAVLPCCCFCAALLAVLCLHILKGYVSFAVFLIESDCHQH